MPHSSEGPKRPQALPRGPSFWRGRESKEGLGMVYGVWCVVLLVLCELMRKLVVYT